MKDDLKIHWDVQTKLQKKQNINKHGNQTGNFFRQLELGETFLSHPQYWTG